MKWIHLLRCKTPAAGPAPRVPTAEDIAAILEAHRYGGALHEEAGRFVVCRCKAQFADSFPFDGLRLLRKHTAEEVAKLWGAA